MINTNLSKVLLVYLALLFISACQPAPPTNTQPDELALGSGVSVDADTAAFASRILDEIQAKVPSDDAMIQGVLRAQAGPTGTIVGLAMPDGSRLYGIGTVGADDIADLTGAVLEDADGNLIMMQENREQGVKITYATGDVLDIDTGGVSPRLTLTLNSTIPPSVISFNLSEDGEAIVDETASAIFTTPNANYNRAPISLPREASAVAKRRPVFQAGSTPGCPVVDWIAFGIEATCLVWAAVGDSLQEGGAQVLSIFCNTLQAALDGIRGSSPIPKSILGIPIFAEEGAPEFAPEIIAGMKIGLEITCQAIDSGLSLASVIKSLNFADLACMVYSFADDGARLASDGKNLPTLICEALTEVVIGVGCSDTCVAAHNGRCEDGGPLAMSAICNLGTDCSDCGPRDVPGCNNTCTSARNGQCEDGALCAAGTDCTDCQRPTDVPGCSDLCETAQDGECQDGGGGSLESFCLQGTDCTDCGPRYTVDPAEPTQEDCFDDGICNVNCPDFEPDMNCTNAELCAAKGFCCVGDATCDIRSCPAMDADCTNDILCSLVGYCCDGDGNCRLAEQDRECPTPDTDCARCGAADGDCVVGCPVVDPDCSIQLAGKVTGFVTDVESGAPIVGAIVAVLGTSRTTSTSLTGSFLLDFVPEGTQQLVASADGYLDGFATITIVANETTTQALQLMIDAAPDGVQVCSEDSDCGLMEVCENDICISNACRADGFCYAVCENPFDSDCTNIKICEAIPGSCCDSDFRCDGQCPDVDCDCETRVKTIPQFDGVQFEFHENRSFVGEGVHTVLANACESEITVSGNEDAPLISWTSQFVRIVEVRVGGRCAYRVVVADFMDRTLYIPSGLVYGSTDLGPDVKLYEFCGDPSNILPLAPGDDVAIDIDTDEGKGLLRFTVR